MKLRRSLVALALFVPTLAACFTTRTTERYELRASDLAPRGVSALVWHAPEADAWRLALQMDEATRELELAHLSGQERVEAARAAQEVRALDLPASPELLAELAHDCAGVTVLVAEDAPAAVAAQASALVAALLDAAPRLSVHRVVLPEPLGAVADRDALEAALGALRERAEVQRLPRTWHSFGLRIGVGWAPALFEERGLALVAPTAGGRFAFAHAPLVTTEADRDLESVPVATLDAAEVVERLAAGAEGYPIPLVLVGVPPDAPASMRAACEALVRRVHERRELEWAQIFWCPVAGPFEELDDLEALSGLGMFTAWMWGPMRAAAAMLPERAPAR